MKILSWNIQHGGGTRASAIVDAIACHAPDIVVLTEYRTKPGAPIRRALHRMGWCHCEATAPHGNDNGVCVLARTPLLRAPSPALPPEHAIRWVEVQLPEHDLGIMAVHIVTAAPGPGERRGEAKARFWEAVLAVAEQRSREPLLLIGDFNTGLPYQDEGGNTFHCVEHFERLRALGWIDAWRHHHGDAIEYTWHSRGRSGRPGNGFRVDHAFVTPILLPRVRACGYSRREREAGTSDHSMMIVEVE